MHDRNTPLDDSFIKRLVEVQNDHESGSYGAAECGYRELINRQPAVWQLHYNLGMLLFEQHRFEEALKCYRDGIAVNETSVDLLYNSGICLKKLNRFSEAIEAYQKALVLAPDDIDCRYNLAGCYRVSGREPEALRTYLDLLEVNSEHVPSLNNAAYLLHKSGDNDRARQLYRRILDADPSHVAADHMLAALSGAKRGAAPESYVRDVFDQFAEHYENNLKNDLLYRLPAQLFALYREIEAKHIITRLLDLGCGTGLIGEQFRPICRSMTGVDLSVKMAAAARKKDIYESLNVCEIVSFLKNNRQPQYDLLISADVFPYMGDLLPVLEAARKCVLPEAYYLFSVEHDSSEADHPQLQKSGRFCHSPCCVEGSADAAGWKIRARRLVDLRKEHGEWVTGSVYALQPC